MTDTKPSRATDAMWWFWTEFAKIEPTVVLGGIYASKPGYHNYRDALPAWDYSVQYALDKLGPGDKAAAIDLTFPDAQSARYETIAKYADRLLRSGKDLHDERGNYLREFYGQADADTAVEGWDFQAVTVSTSDTSHLWHIHLSFMRAYLNDYKAMRAVLSILKGETVEQWRAAEGVPAPTPMPPAPAPKPTPPPYVPTLHRAWPSYMKAGHYFGLLTGPAASHGGWYANERPDVKAIQQRLIVLGYVPGIGNPNSGWADGKFEQATKDAVSRWQRARYAAQTSRYGEVWSVDWRRLFTY